MKLGQAGKGLYWDLIEMLYEEGGYLMLSECDAYAFALRSDSECINSLINDFDLFIKDDTQFWSESVLRRLSKRKEKSEKAMLSAQKRWNNANASKPDANALRPECEGNALKERKGKEKKESNTSAEPKGSEKHEAFLKVFNDLTKRSLKTLDPKAKKQFDKLQKDGYRYNDFVIAITNGFKDSVGWPKPQNFTPEYITREHFFVKYLSWGDVATKSAYELEPKPYYTKTQEEQDALFGDVRPKTQAA
jgi:hypothetical protein